MKYVDGFVIPVPTKNLKKYAAISKKAGKIWMEHGALEYRECIGEDMQSKYGVPFPKCANAKKGESVVFSWIVYKSKAHRNKVNEKVMKDPRMNEMGDPKDMPFDCKKMSYGGFKTIVGD